MHIRIQTCMENLHLDHKTEVANLFGFNFQDNVNYQGVSDLQWNSIGIGSDFLLIPGNSLSIN